jgi:hypothetical protein
MSAFTKFRAGGVAVAALASAAPAAAQYYPGGGYGYGYGGDVIGQVISSVIGGGLGNNGYYNQGYNQGYAQNPYGRFGQAGQYAINQCMGAVQQRLNAGYATGYGYNGGYQQRYGGARVLGVSDVEQRANGGLSVRGVANSGRNAAYAYGYNGQGQVDLTFKCKTDASGYIVDIDIEQATSVYGNPGYSPYNQGYSPYGQDYSQYGYRRY